MAASMFLERFKKSGLDEFASDRRVAVCTARLQSIPRNVL